MKRAKKFSICLGLSLVFVFSLSLPGTPSATAGELTMEQFTQMSYGAVLYDNWPKVLGLTLKETHPSYPVTAKKKGKNSWRCKECHGWDYKGKSGTYRKGSHYTGITGIRAYANQSAAEIVQILKNDTHAFGSRIPDDAVNALAAFVSYGQIDMDRYIDRKTRKTLGNTGNGARVYLSVCAKCHGADGTKINFKSPKKPLYVGGAANKNPWETLHKIRWGHPGSQMASLVFTSIQTQLDSLAFIQTLP